jgi:hypothetical protein
VSVCVFGKLHVHPVDFEPTSSPSTHSCERTRGEVPLGQKLIETNS